MLRQLIKQKKTEDGEGYISLYKFGNQYVTWRSNLDTPDGTYWGHYFMDREIAERDYEKRT